MLESTGSFSVLGAGDVVVSKVSHTMLKPYSFHV